MVEVDVEVESVVAVVVVAVVAVSAAVAVACLESCNVGCFDVGQHGVILGYFVSIRNARKV